MSVRMLFETIRTLGQGVIFGLPEPDGDSDPFDLFGDWFGHAKRSKILMPEAMTLATVSEDGQPSARMVLFKGLDDKGFRFFTNYDSRKGQELRSNPRVALVFHWTALQRQVRIEGAVEQLTSDESNEYFQSRPRGSRIGAWASKQSRPLDARETLEQAVKSLEERFKGQEVPLPPFWGGFRVVPSRIEFWQGRTSRLHDRLVYKRDDGSWSIERLYP